MIAAIVDMAVPGEHGRETPLFLPADAVECLADDFLASDHVVELVPAERRSIRTLGDEPVFTITEMLEVQARILERFQVGRSAGLGLVPPSLLAEALDSHSHLADEQQDLVRMFCASGHRVQCAIGRAGAGKTTTMRAAVAAWTAAGLPGPGRGREG